MVAKSKTVIFDTNVVIRYLLGESSDIGNKAKEHFDAVEIGMLKTVILDSVIAECVYILDKVYKVPKSTLVENLVGLLQYKGIINDDKQVLIAALQLFTKSKLDFVDCLLSAKAKLCEMDLITFDKELIRIHSKNH